MILGILFAILNALFLGVANVLLKKSYKNLSPSISFFLFSLISLVSWGSAGLLMGVDFSNPLFGLAVGLISATLGQAIYIYILSKGELSITSTILSTFSVYTIIFSLLFNNERPSQMALAFVSLAIVGTLIVSLPEKGKFNKNDLRNLGLLALTVFTAICIGASDTLAKFYMTKTTIGSFLFYTAIAQIFVSFIYLRLDKEPISQFVSIFSKLTGYKYALLGSLFVSTSTLFLFLGFSFGLASIVSPISASYPVLTVILALIFLKEKLSIKNAIGVVLVLVAILGIGYVTV